MNKFIILIVTWLCLSIFSSCTKEELPERYKPPITIPDRPDDKEDTDGPNTSPEVQQNICQIEELYSLKMRRELPYPFDAYVLKLSNGHYYYLSRLFLGVDLHLHDYIRFKTYSLLPDEISQIEIVSSAAQSKNTQASTRNFVASDPIETGVAKTFELGVRYSLTFVPIKSIFIVTTDRNLVYTKKFKLDIALKPQDRIVYNVYRLFPNEILAIKKL